MSYKKIQQSLEYTYSQSFRQIYQDKIPSQTHPNQHSQSPSPNKIFIQYQKAPHSFKTHHQKPIKQSKTNRQMSQTINPDNPIQRLHTSNKKYSFSIFVKKYKKYQNQKKNTTQSLDNPNRLTTQEKRIKGTRQINSVIRTLYDNFRKFQNMSKRSQTSKTSRTSSVAEQNQSNSLQEKLRQTARQSTKISMDHSPSYHEKSVLLQRNPTSRTKTNFIKNLNFGQKLQHSRELQNFRANDQSREFLTIGRHEIPFVGYQETQYNTNCFLKIEKCSLQNKDQISMKNVVDFREILLRDRLERDNKKKATDLLNAFSKDANEFMKYQQNTRQNKYVAEMRGVKKTKKKWPKQKQEEIFRNKISPW